MKRRTFVVGTCLSGLCGCLSDGARVGTSPEEREIDATVTVVESDVSTAHATVRGDVLEQFGREQPARVTIQLTNDADSTRTFVLGPSPPFDPSVGTREEGDQELFLVPEDRVGYNRNIVPDEPTDGCWVASGNTVSVDLVASHVELNPGESVERSYLLLFNPDTAECMPEGGYTFESPVELLSEDEENEFAASVTIQIE